MYDSTDYELDWPAELLRSELVALCTHPHRVWTAGEVELLLTEAFHTGVPAADFTRASSLDTWSDTATGGHDWVNDLLDHLDEVREYAPPRPYWPARRAATGNGTSPRTRGDARQEFANLVSRWKASGYLARDFAEPCVDEDSEQHLGRDLNAELLRRLGAPASPKLWPPQPETWDTDTFCGLIEVVHDLVARPRSRWYHDFNDCGLHFSDFDTDAGRRVYRALVNRLLAASGVELRLADIGEDTGRMVHLVDEARANLIERILATPEAGVRARVEHAIARFRARDADAEDKRSAIVALAAVLEDRRALLKKELFRSDEGALFRIANEFDLRHQNDKQHTDYHPAFRDWVFWWYLATIELTDRLLDRQTAQTCTATA